MTIYSEEKLTKPKHNVTMATKRRAQVHIKNIEWDFNHANFIQRQANI